MNELVGRDKVNQVEALMAQMPQVDLKVEHIFSDQFKYYIICFLHIDLIDCFYKFDDFYVF